MPNGILTFLFFLAAVSLTVCGIFVFSLGGLILWLRYRAEAKRQSPIPKNWANLLRIKWLFPIILSSVSIGMVMCLCSLSVPSMLGVFITFPTVVSADWGNMVFSQSNETQPLSNTLNKNPMPNQKMSTSINTAGLKETPILTISLGVEKIPTLTPTAARKPTLQVTATASSTFQVSETKTTTAGKQGSPTVLVITPAASKTSFSNQVNPSQNATSTKSDIPEAEFEGTPPPPDELLPEPDENWEDLH